MSGLAAFDDNSRAPHDFDEQFVRIGRLHLEAHYKVGRVEIDRWLVERGKERLIRLRAAFVQKRNAEIRRAETLPTIGQIISRAIPIEDQRLVSPRIASAAAQHLRIVRNGGFAVSPTPDGGWRIGLRYCSPNELVEFARAKGFDPSLTGPSE
jgi:hypothetical protein